LTIRKLLIAASAIAILGGGGWFGWRWYSTPSIPDIPLTGADKPVVAVIEEAKQEVRKQPRSGAAWGKLGKVLAVNGYREPAILCFTHAAKFDRNNPRWPYLRGVELLKGDPHRGIVLLRQALTLARNPEERATILFRLSTVLIEEGQLDEAQQNLESLNKLDPEGTRVIYGLGLLAIGRQDWTGARNYLCQLNENPTARKRACTLLATLPNMNPDQARMYQQMIARLPDDLPWSDPFVGEMSLYKVNRVDRIEEYWELERQGRREEAIERLRSFVVESPSLEACSTLGFALYKMNEFQDAAEAFRAAIGFNSQNASSHYLLGASLFGLGEKKLRENGGENTGMELFRQAITAEDQALALQNNLGYAHLIRGRALGYLGRTDESLKALRQAVLCQPESAEIHESLGLALANSGQVREALTHLENAARLASPNDPRPRELLEKWRAKAGP
jgi:tetratricopeptide (TPR) repeat protein